MSNWINHVKEYASQKGIKFGDALKHSECKSSYHAKKTEPKPVDTNNNKVVRKKREPVPKETVMDDKIIIPMLTKTKRNNKTILPIKSISLGKTLTKN